MKHTFKPIRSAFAAAVGLCSVTMIAPDAFAWASNNGQGYNTGGTAQTTLSSQEQDSQQTQKTTATQNTGVKTTVGVDTTATGGTSSANVTGGNTTGTVTGTNTATTGPSTSSTGPVTDTNHLSTGASTSSTGASTATTGPSSSRATNNGVSSTGDVLNNIERVYPSAAPAFSTNLPNSPDTGAVCKELYARAYGGFQVQALIFGGGINAGGVEKTKLDKECQEMMNKLSIALEKTKARGVIAANAKDCTVMVAGMYSELTDENVEEKALGLFGYLQKLCGHTTPQTIVVHAAAPSPRPRVIYDRAKKLCPCGKDLK